MVTLIAFAVDTLNPKDIYESNQWVSGRWVSHSGITTANELIEQELPGQLKSLFSLDRHSHLILESDKFGTYILGFVSPPSELEWIPSVLTITFLESKGLSATYLEDLAILRKEGKEKLQKLGIDSSIILGYSRALVYTNDKVFHDKGLNLPIYSDASDFEVHTKIITSLIILIFQETSVVKVSEMASNLVGKYKAGRRFINEVSIINYVFWWPHIMKNLASDSVYQQIRDRSGLEARINQLKEFADRLQGDLSLVERRRTSRFTAIIAALGFIVALVSLLTQLGLRIL